MPDQRVTLDITGVVAGGDGIGRDDTGRVVFVTGALPGERVTALLTETRKDFPRGVIDGLEVGAPERVAPPCRFVADGCGGCDWQHVAVAAQPVLKRDLVVDALRRIARLAPDLVDACVALPAVGYRTTVRVATDRAGRPAFRKALSHDLVTVDDCLVAHPTLAAMLQDGRWPGAEEVVLRVGDRTDETMVDVRPRPEGGAVAGAIHEIVAGRRFRISPESFFQIRPDGADELVGQVAAALASLNATSVVDLYAGVGLFAGTLHDRGHAILAAVETAPTSVGDARANLHGICDVVEADVGRWPGVPVDAVVADPSRRGLMKDGVATIVRCDPRVVVLVSCDVAAFGRDTKLLTEAGFELLRATPIDLFPHTAHVEVVSTFARSGEAS